MSNVRPETSRKINVNPRRNSSSTIMPAREMLPVIQRCVGRTKASTSITNTAATETITSGAINDQLMMGITDCAKKEFIPVDYVAAASVFRQDLQEHVNLTF